MVKTKKGDFIEIDFTATIKDGNVFDTTLESEAKKRGLMKEGEKQEGEKKFNPFRLCIGEEMILKGLDNELTDKEIGKEYTIELNPEKAFGKRNPKLIKIFSLGSFVKKRMMPEPGQYVNINDMVAKVMNVSGGRVVVDFNNPLADKIVVYKVKINKIIEDEKEKIDAIANFYFVDYEIREKESKDNEKKQNKGYILVVKGNKIEALEKKIKNVLPELEISYQ
jgi:FKBP-type peptidyl-prolyl cis-trans isomerase 2